MELHSSNAEKDLFQSLSKTSLFKQEMETPLKYVSSSEGLKAKLRAQVLSLLVELFICKEGIALPDLMSTLEKNILMKVLAQCNGSIKESSIFLGIKYTTLYEKLKKYNISLQKHPVTN